MFYGLAVSTHFIMHHFCLGWSFEFRFRFTYINIGIQYLWVWLVSFLYTVRTSRYSDQIAKTSRKAIQPYSFVSIVNAMLRFFLALFPLTLPEKFKNENYLLVASELASLEFVNIENISVGNWLLITCHISFMKYFPYNLLVLKGFTILLNMNTGGHFLKTKYNEYYFKFSRFSCKSEIR